MPQVSQKPLNACLKPPMYIIVALLLGRQSANKQHNDMHSAFISTAIASNLKKQRNHLGDENVHTQPILRHRHKS